MLPGIGPLVPWIEQKRMNGWIKAKTLLFQSYVDFYFRFSLESELGESSAIETAICPGFLSPQW